jgi:ankyrin repeat protein
MCNVQCVIKCVFSKLIQDMYGNTPLINACRRGHVETARVLLDHGANVDYQNKVK